MNENEQRMKEQAKNERMKIIAMALDIAIKLTNVDHKWISQDNDGNVIMDEPLYSTVRLVIRAISDDQLMAIGGLPKVVKGIMRETGNKS